MKFEHDGRCFHLEWHNPATKEVSYAKGERASYYWERGFDGDVLIWLTASEAEAFAKERVSVPFKVGQGEPK